MAFLRGVAFGLGFMAFFYVAACAFATGGTSGNLALLGLFLLVCGLCNWQANR